MSAADRCPICDRPEALAPGGPGCQRAQMVLGFDGDCNAHRVDWRARAIAADAIYQQHVEWGRLIEHQQARIFALEHERDQVLSDLAGARCETSAAIARAEKAEMDAILGRVQLYEEEAKDLREQLVQILEQRDLLHGLVERAWPLIGDHQLAGEMKAAIDLCNMPFCESCGKQVPDDDRFDWEDGPVTHRSTCTPSDEELAAEANELEREEGAS